MNNLPNELISLIISHLKTQSDVASFAEINKAINNEIASLLWRHLSVNTSSSITNLIDALDTSTRPPSFHTVQLLLTCEIPCGPSFVSLMQHFPHLQHLKVSVGVGIKDANFKHLPKFCPQLVSIELSRVAITHVSMQALGQHCQRLVSLKINGCRMDYTKTFQGLQGCSALAELDISTNNLYRAHDFTIHTKPVFTDQAATALASHRPRLKSLRLQDGFTDFAAFFFASFYFYATLAAASMSTATTIMTTTSTTPTVWTWTRLTHLSLSKCNSLVDGPLIAFLRAHPQLLFLEIHHTKITNAALDAIVDYLPGIQTVEVPSNPALTATGLLRLIRGCPTLVGRVHCVGCKIFVYDDDFPQNLDRRYYHLGQHKDDDDDWFSLDRASSPTELVWLSCEALASERERR